MRPRKSGQDRKAEIVNVLLVLADRIGPDRLTTNDVAAEVKITQAAIFRHFPTKADIRVMVADVVIARMSESWDVALAQEPERDAQRRALVLAQFALIEACPALPSILFSRELEVENPQLRERFAAILMIFQGHLAMALTRDQGKLRADLSPDDTAVFVTALVQGVAIRWTLGARGACHAGSTIRHLPGHGAGSGMQVASATAIFTP
jgi:AcrR family transcriptional regulator